ncbi:hypothetical protein ANO11243_094360 [Dothideomycetidae sp. 11243]|nr:hypothetical protein ANO11243_094360 [fungal sp. No.11243]
MTTYNRTLGKPSANCKFICERSRKRRRSAARTRSYFCLLKTAFQAAAVTQMYVRSPLVAAAAIGCALAALPPLGFSGFALTTFVMALINLSASKVTTPNVIIGPALAYGGLAQLLAGMWDMASGNTVGATIMTSYGCFWISYAIMLIPSFGVAASYPTIAELNHAIGFFIIGFFIFSIAITFCSLKSNTPTLALCVFVNITFLTSSIAHFVTEDTGKPHVILTKVSGGFGLVASLIAWYIMYTELANKSNSYVVPPELLLPWGQGKSEMVGGLGMESKARDLRESTVEY